MSIISIHALREEGDPRCFFVFAQSFVISIHALREEGDRPAELHQDQQADFYPRPPRGGRPDHCNPSASSLHFYPRPPRGGRPA